MALPILTIQSSHDAALGAAAVALSLMAYGLWTLRQVPRVQAMRSLSKAPVQHFGADDAITVLGFQQEGHYPAFSKGVTDGSPYVARVECYLRLLGKPYTKKRSLDVRENPRKKLPVANVYGTMVDDSGRILDAIHQYYGMDPHQGLSEVQRRNGHFVRRLLTGSLYWVRYYINFGMEEGRQDLKDEMAGLMPAPVLAFIYPMVVRSQCANLQGHGLARLPEEDIFEAGKADLRALASLLGTQSYILGTKDPTVYDSDVYAFVSHLFYDASPAALPWVKEIRAALPLLDHYVARMRSVLFPSLKEKET